METESNQIIIIDSASKSKVYLMGGILIFLLVILNAIFGIITFNMQTFKDTLNSILILHLPVSAFFLFLLFYFSMLYASVSKISISDNRIEFKQFPKRHPVTVNWTDFDMIKLKVSGARGTSTGFSTRSQSIIRTLRIRFLRDTPPTFSKRNNHKIFSDSKVSEILRALVNFAKRMNKNIIINHRTQRYYHITV